jgi:hypothetical protein
MPLLIVSFHQLLNEFIEAEYGRAQKRACSRLAYPSNGCLTSLLCLVTYESAT